MRRFAFLCGCCTIALGTLPGRPAAQAGPQVQEGLRIARTFEHRLRSTIDGREYQFWVAVPPGYPSAAGTRYPVLFLLDGGRSFPAATISYRNSHAGADSLVMVGVGFVDRAGGMARRVAFTLPVSPGSDSNTVRWARRNECCAAAVTARVFREELIPFIDSLYRTTSDRGIVGHSHGGLFATYLLFHDPELFRRFGISSPALWWDTPAIFAHEAAFAKTHETLAKDVVILVGGHETPVMIQGAHRLAATLQARDYQGLRVTLEELPGAVHSSMETWTRIVNLLYPIRNTTTLSGDPVDLEPARRAVLGFLDAYGLRDVGGLRPFLRGDSTFQAIIGDRIIAGREGYLSHLADEFQVVGATFVVDSLRVSSDDPGMATAIVSFWQTASRSAVGGVERGRLIFELVQRPEGWRITHIIHASSGPARVVTSVSVHDTDGPVVDAEVTATTDLGQVASARTDASGYARLRYDWRGSRALGHLQVTATGYASAVAPLPNQDSLSVRLQRIVAMSPGALLRYLGEFADTTGGRTRIVRLGQDGTRLIIEGLPGLRWTVAEFLSPMRLAVRDGSEIELVPDSDGVVRELLWDGSRFVRR